MFARLFACAAVLALCSSPALAKKASAVRVHVKNCSSDARLVVESFNGKDKAADTFYKESKSVGKDGGTEMLKCRGQGKGHCWLRIMAKASAYQNTDIKKKLKKGKWVKVTTSLRSMGEGKKDVVDIHTSVSDSEPSCD